MLSTRFRTSLRMVLGFAAVCLAAVSLAAQTSGNVFTGTVDKVDSGAKTISVKTADGTVKTVKFTEGTTVDGLKGAAKGTDLAGKEGGHVIVHSVGTGTDETARSVEWVGDKSVHTVNGTVEDVGKGSKTVAVKTAEGTKETFVVADHATVNSGKDVALYSARGAEKGEHVTVYYTETAGKKIAHVFSHF